MRIAKHIIMLSLLLRVAALVSYAQQIKVDQFEKIAHHASLESNLPTITFFAAETGFTFQADGNDNLEAKPGTDCMSVSLPRKTKFIKIAHPSYGELYWKIPSKLHNLTDYRAYIHTWGPDKKFELVSQWVSFNISPADCIVRIDSTLTLVRDGHAQFYLPLGTHRYIVESPYHEAVEDSLVLDSSKEVRLDINLQPFESYVEKLKHKTFGDERGGESASGADGQGLSAGESETITAHVLICSDSLSSIMINREPVGIARWEGDLPQGYYIINSRYGALESSPTQLWINDAQPRELRLYAAANDVGAINVHGDVADAQVYVDGLLVGNTPCVVANLDAGRAHRVKLVKQGYKTVEQTVHPIGGSVFSVEINMKKK